MTSAARRRCRDHGSRIGRPSLTGVGSCPVYRLVEGVLKHRCADRDGTYAPSSWSDGARRSSRSTAAGVPGVPGPAPPRGGLGVRVRGGAARWVTTADTSAYVSGDAVDIGP